MQAVTLDFELCRKAAEARDARFDGWFFTAVTSTGIYCRPSCPARTPKRENVRLLPDRGRRAVGRLPRLHALPARRGARLAGVELARRPRGSGDAPDRRRRGRPRGRDRAGRAASGTRERHLHRQLMAEVGAGPLALARAQRAQTARMLLETTALPSPRSRSRPGSRACASSTTRSARCSRRRRPSLRRRAPRAGRPRRPAAPCRLRLPYRGRSTPTALHRVPRPRAPFPASRRCVDGAYRRGLRLPHGARGMVELRSGRRPRAAHAPARRPARSRRRGRSAAAACSTSTPTRTRSPSTLGPDPILGPLRRRRRGVRVPGQWTAPSWRCAPCSASRCRWRARPQLAGRLVARRTASTGSQRAARAASRTCSHPPPPSRRPTPRASAMPRAALARSWPSRPAHRRRHGRRSTPAPTAPMRARRLLALPGIGPWTAAYVAMRALRDPDAFLPTDLGVRRALERLGRDGRPQAATRVAERWRPYRAYAIQHLWAQLA